jgi:hypothetical protein
MIPARCKGCSAAAAQRGSKGNKPLTTGGTEKGQHVAAKFHAAGKTAGRKEEVPPGGEQG